MKTDQRIVQVAQELLATGGIAAVSFDAIARELGLSKQAVLYWFPSKQALLAGLFLGWLRAEATAVEQSLSTAPDSDAIAAFVRSLAAFHLGDLNRFRLMYLVPQTLPRGAQGQAPGPVMAQIHATTARVYAALADRLPGDPVLARRQAVAIHAAVLGLMVMVGLAASSNDPLKHGSEDLVEALVARLQGGQLA